MKVSSVLKLFVLLLAVTLVTPGCRKRPTPITDIPGTRPGAPVGPGPGGAMTGDSGLAGSNLNSSGLTPLGPGHEGWAENTEALRADTVYFEFDSSAVRQNQESKIEAVAGFLKGDSVAAVRR